MATPKILTDAYGNPLDDTQIEVLNELHSDILPSFDEVWKDFLNRLTAIAPTSTEATNEHNT